MRFFWTLSISNCNGRFKRWAKANRYIPNIACFIFAIFVAETKLIRHERKYPRVERSLPKSNSRANLLYFPPCDPFSASEEWSFTLNAPQSLGVIQNSRNRYATHFRIPRLTYPFIPHSERGRGMRARNLWNATRQQRNFGGKKKPNSGKGTRHIFQDITVRVA